MADSSFKAGWTAQIFFYIAAFSLYVGWQTDTLLVGALFALGVGLVGVLIASRHERQGEADRRAHAESMLARVRSAEAADASGDRAAAEIGDYVLYLRPFAVTARLGISNPEGGALLTPQGMTEPRRIDLETLIARALESHAPLIGLGEPGEHTGAGRIYASEEEWQRNVRILARHAYALLVLPADTSGLLWELEWLKQSGLLDRCVLLMPPASADGMDAAAHWARCAGALGPLGIRLAPFEPGGMLFRLERDTTGVWHASATQRRRLTAGESAIRRDLLQLTDAVRPERAARVRQRRTRLARRKPRTVSYLWIAAGATVVASVAGLCDRGADAPGPIGLEGGAAPAAGVPGLDGLMVYALGAGLFMDAPADWQLEAGPGSLIEFHAPDTQASRPVRCNVMASAADQSPADRVAWLESVTAADVAAIVAGPFHSPGDVVVEAHGVTSDTDTLLHASGVTPARAAGVEAYVFRVAYLGDAMYVATCQGEPGEFIAVMETVMRMLTSIGRRSG